MPPITSAPQNSRATLISWLVVFVILFVTAASFAIYYNVQWNKDEVGLNSLTQKYKQTVNDAELAELQGRKNQGSLTQVGVLLDQNRSMAKWISGSEKMSPVDANNAAKAALADAQKQLDDSKVALTLPTGDNLLEGVRLLAKQAVDSAAAANKAMADAKAAHDEALKVTQSRDALLAEKDKEIAAANQKAEQALLASSDYQKSKDGNISEITRSASIQVAEAYKQQEAMRQVLEASQQITRDQATTISKLQNKLERLRLNPNEALQQADGEITQVPDDKTVYINIGQRQSVTPGLTFEVYDRTKGLPKLTSAKDINGNDLDQPAGKASIEVQRVFPDFSQCKIVKTAPGQHIFARDLIENLIFDPHTKYNFFVFGDFDISQTGTPNPNDAELIRRLIRDWGGKLQSEVNVDTDFVVLGKEPVIPVLTEEDRISPAAQARYQEKVKELNAYQEIVSKAAALRIPPLNQNKFLYFVGFYDQAKR
ncbi:MAG TPA: hypothetical protein VH370_25070 [Humisphaera sp.]|jgi:hypothetical protein|nr:hypothetical protein [Humisphaera sp.]